MNPTSPIDRSRLFANRTSVGQRLLSSWFRRPALWSLISLCTATALVLAVHAAKTENNHIEPSQTASLLVAATGRNSNDAMITVLANTISGTVLDANGNPITGGRVIKLIQNGTLSGTTATSDSVTGIYTFTGLTLASGDKIAVYFSGAAEKGATVTLSGTADITNLDIRQNALIVRTDNGGSITNANLKEAEGGTADPDLTAVRMVDPSNVLSVPTSFTLEIWSDSTYAPGADINDSGNWRNNGTFVPATHTVTFNGTLNQTITGSSSTTFNALTIANTGDPDIPNNIVSLDGTAGATNTVVSHLTITAGVFDQGTASASSNLIVNGTGKCIDVAPGGKWQNRGHADETLSCDAHNEGIIEFNGLGQECGEADEIQIRSSVNGVQRTWEGPGTFSMTDIDVQDQKVPGGSTLPLQIIVSSGFGIAQNNTGWVFKDTCAGPFTWIGGAGKKWNDYFNYSPVRLDAAEESTSDDLIYDGTVTPTTVVAEVKTQTLKSIRLKNGVSVTLTVKANSGSILTLNGNTGADLDVPVGTLLRLADDDNNSTRPLTIRLTAPTAGGTVPAGHVAGQIIMRDDEHQLIGDNAGEISITGGLTIDDTFSATTHPFGTGTNGSVVFQSGSTGSFNAGLDPFGGIGHSVVTFNAGSTARFSKATAFFGGGETYGNLILDGDNQSYFLAGPDQTTIFNDFRLVTGNTFVFSSTPGADMNLFGNFRDETVLSGQFQSNGRTIKFQGTTQTIFFAGSLGTLSGVSIAQTPGGKVQLLTPTRITGQLNFINADSLLELNGQGLQLEGTVTGTGNLKGDPSANLVVLGPVGLNLGTVNFVSGGRTLSGLQLNRANASMTLGTDLALGGTLRLDNGLLNTGTNTLSLSPTTSLLRTNGYVIGNLQKSFGVSGTGSFTFPLGTANAYSPLDANVTANTNGTLTAKAVQGQQPNTPGGANALQRYWTLSGSGITADLTFHYRGGAPTGGDVVGSEGNYKVIKYDGSFTQSTPDATGSNSATDHFATLNNVSSFSDWTLSEPFAVQSGTISFLNAPYSDNETNANHNVTITVQRLSGSNGAVTVHYATGDGAATAGSDYTSVSGDLTWADGDTADKTFAIPIIGDTTFELGETVNITLSAPTGGATIVGTNPATLTITNDDAADTDISVSAGNLVVSDGNGGNTDDALTLSLNGPNIRINDPNHTLSCGGGTPIDTHTCEIPFSSITGNIQVNTLGGIDTLTLALAGGNFFPPGGVIYNGGNPATAPGDKLIITGGNQGTVTYHYNNAHDGTIGMSNIGAVTFTGLEPISNTGLAADIIFELPPGPNSATLGDDGTGGNSFSRLSGVTFETTDFSNPTGSLTIKRDSAADTVTVSALPDFNASLAIGSVANPFSTITVGGPITLTGAPAVTLMAGDVSGGGNISTGGGLTVGITGANSTLSGVISGAGGLTKLGAGTLVVSGADTYTGATTVGAGRLNVNGSIISNVTVTATGTLGGAGSINSANTLTVIGGAIAPGASPGILNTGNVSFANASNLQIEIGGPTPGNAASNHDQLNVTGTISLGNPTLILSSFNGFVPSAGQSFVIINNDGSDAVSGTFSGLAEGATITNFLGSSLNATITYAGGTNSNDVVVLTVVPFCNAAPVVTNTGDNGGVNPAPAAGTGTLRQALVDVCAGGTITFDTAGVFATPRTITLSNQLTIGTDNVTIDGPDPATQRVTIAGGGTSRLFSIQAGKTATIRDLTLTGGSAPGANGGAIYNDRATLTLIGMTVSNSTADFGGGIYNDGRSSGGRATLTIIDSTFSGNTTHFGDGGAINNVAFPAGGATLNLTNSTISGNKARGNGGGIISNGPPSVTPVTITNCTITNNRANNENDSSGEGGGLTFIAGSPTTLRNSIVDLNFRGASPSTTADDISGGVFPPSASSYNLIGSCQNPCLLTNGVNNNLLNVSAASLKLGPLAANGAINQTHALLPGSIALEAGNNAYVVAPPFLNVSPFTDERGTGFPRIADTADADAVATVDIGAFELHPTIEDITNKTTPEDTPLSFNFNIGDGTGALITSVTAASSNTVLVPNDVGHLSVTGSGSTRTLNVTPAADANSPTNGTATITVTVTATSGQTAQDTFALTVTEVNDAPVPTNDSLTAIAEDSGQRIIPFGNLLGNDFNRGAANESGQTVTVTAVSNAVGGTVTLDTPNSRVLFTPSANFNGAASFLYQVTDNGTTNGSLDAKSGTATASFTVNPINDPPTLTTNATLSVSNGGLRLIRNTKLKVDDVDNTATQLVYTIGTVPANGTLRLSGVELFGGGTFTQDDINNNRLTYQHNGSATGSDSFTFTYSDGIVAPIGPNTFNINICPNKLVTNTNDSGAGSLRQATLDVCDGGTISFDTAGVFSTPQTITLSSQLTVGVGSDDVTIDGPDPAGQRVTINGGGTTRLFTIQSGKTATIRDLTLTGGSAPLANNFGGAIHNDHATLTLAGVTVSGNTAGSGGGIYNDGLSSPATLTIINSTISGNTASAGAGGAIYSIGSLSGGGATLNLTNTTISGNNSSGSGGGVYSEGRTGATPVNITSSTITNNRADIGNTGTPTGGGLFIFDLTTLTLHNSIVDLNFKGASPSNDLNDIVGPVVAGGASTHNLIGSCVACGLTDGVDNNSLNVSAASLNIGPLAANGAINQTHALLPGSIAIEAGNDVTTLNGGIDIVQSLIILTNATAFPAGVGFAIRIDDEQMIVNDKLTPNSLTVTRGANGTTAVSHNSGAGVSPAFDERGSGFLRLVRSHLDIGAFEAATNPPSSADNARTFAEDNNYIFTIADFPFSDPDSDTFTNVKIILVATAGALFFDSDGAGANPPVAVTLNQLIPVADISAGHLFFTPAADGSGTPYATFQFAVQDDGGAANGGSNLSTNYTFTMNVTEVNDAPSFQLNGNPTVNEDAGLQTVSGFATNFQPGPPTATNEAGQTLSGYTLSLTGSTGGLTFSSGPAIDNTGTLTYTPTANASGTATFSVVATDSGSGIAPNVNQSVPLSFTITVNAQNDAPTLATNAGLSVGNGGTGAIDNTKLKVEDVDNTATELVYTIGTAPANGTLKKNGVDLSGGSTFTQDDIDNSLITYQHNGSAILSDSFTFTVSDGAGGSIGLTTFNINIGCGNSITVTSNADSGDGTLRQAIAGICDGGTITFDMTQVVSPITLTSGLTIAKNLTIQGPGANLLTITGNDTFGLIKANTGGINVNIDGLSFTHGGPDAGNAVAIEFVGGGTLTVSNCEFSANTDNSLGKAVIYSSLSTGLTVKASTLGNNTTLNAILSDRSPLTVVNSTISNNSGTAINSSAVGSTVLNSTIADNGNGVQSDGSLCGGCAASVTVTNSLFSSNGGQNILATGGGTITSGGHNLLDDATAAAFTNPADPTNIIVAPGTAGIAAALANNGGPTRTRALVLGTLALDAGDNTAATNAGLTNDQRGPGFNRIADGPDVDTITTVDIGAFEGQLSVTNATTNEGIQTTSGLVIRRDAAQGVLPTHFKITGITNGTLFKNDGTTQISNGDFITVAEGNAGLKFTPAANLSSPATTFSFQAQASSSNSDAGLIIGVVTATITVNPIAGTPSVTNATTTEDTLTGPDLVISINAADGAEVTHFKIIGITNGRLFQNDGTTVIVPNSFITVAEGNAGLKFRPRPNLFSPSTTFSFQVQAATSNTGAGLSAGLATATITVNPVADTPSVTSATTNEDIQTTSGLIISRNAADGAEVTHFKITGITNGTLFQNDGTTLIVPNSFITVAEGNAGLKFRPGPNLFSPSTTFSFQVQAATSNTGTGLSAGLATATITVSPVADTPAVISATTSEDLQTTSGLVISRNAADGAEVTHFKITGITNGTLFKNDGTTVIANNSFITFAEGNGGLKFTPGADLFSPGTPFSFQVQASLSNSDAGLGGSLAIATITVNAQNDAPTLTTNAGLSVGNGGTGTIDSTRLKVEDVDNPATELVYTIGTASANGTLKKNGVDLSGGGTFTQADINNGLITYQHNGSATFTDSFTFTVSDGAGGAIGSTTFNINIGCGNSIIVTSNADSGDGTLRQAIAGICDGGTITFDMNQVVSPITLTSGLTINKNLTIQGPGANLLTITGNDTFGLIKANTAGINVNIDRLSFTHGGPDAANAVAIEFVGGGTLTVSNCEFAANTGASKAVIYTSQSTGLTLRASTFGNNTTLNTILSDRTPLTVVNSTISNNSGAAINNSAVGSTVTNSTIADNGSGVQSDGSLCGGCAASVTVTNSLFSSNGGQNIRTTGGGTITSGGHSLIDDATSAAFTNPADPTNIVVAPGTAGIAATLANNGGPTRTRALVAGTLALDAGDNTAATNAGLTNDQRGPGFNRIADGPDVDTITTVDIGAFEAQLSVTNATTNEGIQTTSGLVIRRDAAQSVLPTHFKITAITNGTLFKNDGTTQINNGDFITVGEGNAGLKFTPAANLFSPATAFSFQAQASSSGDDLGLIIGVVTATITVNPIAGTPSVTNATTTEDTQNTSGLVISINAGDGAEVTHFKITGVTNGTLFQNDGTTVIVPNSFITFAQGNAGLKFAPGAGLFSPGTSFSFQVQAATSNTGTGLSGGVATATITVNPVADTPAVTNATTSEDIQTTSGLVISRNAADGAEVTHFKITGITNGTLFKNDGTTVIVPNSFITFAEGNGGLKFTPGAGLFSPGTPFSFQVQASLSNSDAGLGGSLATATITVNAQNDAPTLAINAGLSVGNGGTATIDSTRLKVEDVDNTATELVYTIGTAPANGTLKKNGVDLSGGGTFTQDDIDNSLITYQHNGSATFTDSFTFTVSDGAGGSIGLTTFNINVGCGNSITVTSNADSGNGTLRQAIAGICDGGTITFDMTQVISPITLTSGLTIAKNLTIQGPGANLLTITGNDTFGLIKANTAGINVNIDGLSFTHGGPDAGNAVAVEFVGGGTLTVSSCEFSANTGAGKAVLYTSQSTGLTLRASTFGNNTTLNTVLSDRTPLTVVNSTISNNSGAAINSSAVGSTVTNSTVANNGIGVQSDGGLCGCAASVTVTNSLFSSNGGQNLLTTGGGTITSGGHNLLDDATSAAFTNPADPTNIIVAPGTAGIAATLANNGGPTRTRALVAGTLALDAGDNTAATNAGLTNDQRGPGFNRIADGPDVDTITTVDIGAFEAQLSVTNATTNEGIQTTSGLVIRRDAAQGVLPTHFKITGITNGTLFQNNGTTQINNGDFITVAEGNAGLKFTPAANLFSPATTFSFQAQASSSNSDAGLIIGVVTATIAVNPIAGTPSVTNATTTEDTQNTSGLVISTNAGDGAEVTHFKITGITNGRLFQNDGTTVIVPNSFITVAEGNAGLKFRPRPNLFSPSTTFSFQVQAATSNTGTGLSAGFATATITVNPVADTPSVTNATTNLNTQTTAGLVISRNVADGAEVTHFKITGITNGTLFKNNGTTQINNNDFITFAEGNAGLKFTPGLNSTSAGNFDVQAATSNTGANLSGTVTATITVGCGSTTVTNSNDSGAGSLRSIINGACAGATITFDMTPGHVTSPIKLTSGELLINKNLTIRGPGANVLTISGNNASRVLNIAVGATVTIDGLTIANGRASDGAGIWNSGTLTLNRCLISGNNNIGSFGGGILNRGVLLVTDSTISGNASASRGAGLQNLRSPGDQPVTATLIGSTISGNTARSGAGIHNEGASLILTNCTVSGNTANSSDPTGSAGGLENVASSFDTTAALTNCTFNGNRQTSSSGPNADDIYSGNFGKVSTVTLRNTILGGSAATATPNLGTFTNGVVPTPGVITSLGGNLSRDNGSGFLSQPNDLIDTNPLLAPLGSYGGTTATHALLPGSPALNAGNNCVTEAAHCGDSSIAQLTTDQRGAGFNRVVGSAVDVGAFESRGFTISIVSGTPQSTLINTPFALPLVASIIGVGGEPVAGGIIAFTAPATGASAALTGGSAIASAPIDANGKASTSATANAIGGSYNVNATAAGVTSVSFALTNNKANSATAVASSLDPSDLGQSVTFTATVTSAMGTPTGIVQFKDGGANLGAPMALNVGVAQVSTSSLASGTHIITAEYSGDGSFLSSTGTLLGGQLVRGQPSLSIDDVSVAEGNAGTTVLTFTITLSEAGNLPVSVDYATANGTATAGSDYVAIPSTLLTFNPGEVSKQVSVSINGDINLEADETFFVNLFNPVNATISDSQGVGTILNDDAQGGIISFSQANYNVDESTGIVTVTVTRSNDLSQAAQVDYATDDTGASIDCAALNTVLASQRCDYTSVFGTLKFAANETQKTIDIPVNLDAYNEGPETFTVKLSNPTGGAFLAEPSTAIVTINDSASPTPNAIDDTTNFVRQQYHDFLNRDADPAGLAFWKNNIDKCNDPAQLPPGQTLAQCIEVQRILTSAAFFLSIEFKETGGLVRYFYVAALDRPLTNNMPDYVEFMRDTQAIQKDLVVGQGNWQQLLDANRQAFMNDFVMRGEFVALYPTTDTPTEYVDKLYQHANVAPVTVQERLDAILEFGGAPTAADPGARGRALLRITQNGNFRAREATRTFVHIEYFGYLRRNPNDLPDSNFNGYNFWVDKLNQFNGNFLDAEMVKAFLNSIEYRKRFGP